VNLLLRASQEHVRRHADLAGAAASGICLIHCLLMPVLVSCIPGFVAYIPGNAGFHHTLAAVVVLLGTAAFVPGYRLHRRKALLALVTTGISLVLVVAWSGDALNSALELILSLAGSSMLIGAHLLNRSFCRQCLDCKQAESCSATKIN
jgi:hypothetical protein